VSHLALVQSFKMNVVLAYKSNDYVELI